MKSKIFLSAALIILQISTNLPGKKYLLVMLQNILAILLQLSIPSVEFTYQRPEPTL